MKAKELLSVELKNGKRKKIWNIGASAAVFPEKEKVVLSN